MGTISKNFSYSEFEHTGQRLSSTTANVINSVAVRNAIWALVTAVLQPLREAYGQPLKINSGYRCPELNRLVGGVPTSQHCKGEAADIASDNPLKLAQLAYDLNLPFDQMIIYPTFVHFSHKLSESQRGQVLYNKSYKGPKIKIK